MTPNRWVLVWFAAMAIMVAAAVSSIRALIVDNTTEVAKAKAAAP